MAKSPKESTVQAEDLKIRVLKLSAVEFCSKAFIKRAFPDYALQIRLAAKVRGAMVGEQDQSVARLLEKIAENPYLVGDVRTHSRNLFIELLKLCEIEPPESLLDIKDRVLSADAESILKSISSQLRKPT